MIVHSLQWAGYHVTDLSAVGKGVPDLLCTHAGQCYLIEIKNKQGRNSFTPSQVEYYAQVKAPVFVIRTINDVESFIKGELSAINYEKTAINRQNGGIKAEKASTLDG